jgi:chloramphenicol-sensitive protein RarD
MPATDFRPSVGEAHGPQDGPYGAVVIESQDQGRAGLMYGLAAYLAWGFFPIYFRLLKDHAPMEVLGHRVVWSVLFLAVVLAAQRRWGEVVACLRHGRAMLWLLGSTTAIAVNWYVFIWAMGRGYVLQSSLGYYINPLVTVLLGRLFLRERLRPGQKLAVGLAAAGVLTLTIYQREFPGIALALAVSFALYGLLRKTAHVGAMVGLAVETALLLPLGLWLVGLGVQRDFSAGGVGLAGYKLLPWAGVITAVPLIWFANAARRLRLTTMGFLQYITPTCHFLLALAYGERLTAARGVAFGCIWVALAVYSADSVRGYLAAANRGRDDATEAQLNAD